MITALTKKISRLFEKHNISSNDIDLINVNILKQLNCSHSIHRIIENHIAHLIEKYDINHEHMYNLGNQVWSEVMHFKFNNPKVVISMRCKRKKIRF